MSTGVLISKSEQKKTVPPHYVVDTVVSYYCIYERSDKTISRLM